MTDARLVRFRKKARWEQNNRCCYCNVEMTDSASGEETSCTAEHVVPRAWGGCDTRHNIKAACLRCNRQRADGAAPHQRNGKKHERNRRIDDTVEARQERKRLERLNMWRNACPAR